MSSDRAEDPGDGEVTERDAVLEVHFTARIQVPVDDFGVEQYDLDAERLMRQRALDKVRGSEVDWVFGGIHPDNIPDVQPNGIEIVGLK